MDENLYLVNQPNPPSKRQTSSAPRSRSRGTSVNNASFRPPTADEIARNELHSQLYLTEVAAHLIEDINTLRDEIQPMRDEIRFLINMDSNFTETFRENRNQKQKKKNVSADLSSQIAELTLLSDELNQIHQKVRNSYSDYSKNQLMNNIDEESQFITQMEDEISLLNAELVFKKQNLQKMQDSNLKSRILENATKIAQLNEVLLSLRKEEKEKIEIHQSILSKRPAVVQSKSGIDKLKKKLEIVKHTHFRKEQEVSDQKAKYDYQKNQVKIIMENRKREIDAQKKRIEENRLYKANLIAERQRRLKEFEENEMNMKTEKKIRIIKNEKNNAKKIKVTQYPNSRLFDDEKANAKAKSIMEQNIQLLIDKDIIKKSQIALLQNAEEEQPKKRFHHHRRSHRKHHHSNNEGDSYVFTTSDPRFGELRSLIGMVDNDNYDANNDKNVNELDKSGLHSMSSSSGDNQAIENSTKNDEQNNIDKSPLSNDKSNIEQNSSNDKESANYQVHLGENKEYIDNKENKDSNNNQENKDTNNNQIEISNDKLVNNEQNEISIKDNIIDQNNLINNSTDVNQDNSFDKNNISDKSENNDNEPKINQDSTSELNNLNDKVSNTDIISNDSQSIAIVKNSSCDQTNIDSNNHENDENSKIVNQNVPDDKNVQSDKNNISDNGKDSEHTSSAESNHASDKLSGMSSDQFVSFSDKSSENTKSSSTDKTDSDKQNSNSESNMASDKKTISDQDSHSDKSSISDQENHSSKESSTAEPNNSPDQSNLNADTKDTQIESNGETFELKSNPDQQIISDKFTISESNNFDDKNDNADQANLANDTKDTQIESNDAAFELKSNSDQQVNNDKFTISESNNLEDKNNNPVQSNFIYNQNESNDGSNEYDVFELKSSSEQQAVSDTSEKPSKNNKDENHDQQKDENEDSELQSSISIEPHNRVLKPRSFLKFLYLNPNIVNNSANANSSSTNVKQTENTSGFDLGIHSGKKKRKSFLFNKEIRVEFNEEEEDNN